ncbi:MAG: sigma-54-dependent Fis family transcriptional regulator [Acidobacteria bacterium]|nr:sigma-54-dependent Fis family transcriptional regulator [Acidobacteriota bacterium]MBI3663019.1 sigma-54-dependent Fis family transcriptional regulator [Acidobacteriota bacterium]
MSFPAARRAEPANSILVASSNLEFRNHVLETLHLKSWLAVEASSGADALAKAEAGRFEALLLDRWLPDLEFKEVAAILQIRNPKVEVLMMDSETAEPIIADGPCCSSRARELLRIFQSSTESPVWECRTITAPAPTLAVAQVPARFEALPGMVGPSDKLAEVSRLARLVSHRNTTVLLAGETGTGKEVVARAVYRLSQRASQPFVVVNCAAIPESLLEAELFGYARGAFTGAFQSYLGKIHAAHGGTLLLDEIGELPLSMQVKLLRFLQEGEVQRLGSQDAFRVDVRVIAATNADLKDSVRTGAFRRDLYYRLAVFPITIPPLRDRVEDIVPLADHFLAGHSRQAGAPRKALSAAACSMLEHHSWPGNVRELQHEIERAFILSGDLLQIFPEHLSFAGLHA